MHDVWSAFSSVKVSRVQRAYGPSCTSQSVLFCSVLACFGLLLLTVCSNCACGAGLCPRKRGWHEQTHTRQLCSQSQSKLYPLQVASTHQMSTLITSLSSDTAAAARQQSVSEQDLVPVKAGSSGTARCGMCLEPMTEKWIDEKEDWFFVGAVTTETGTLVHSHCFKDRAVCFVASCNCAHPALRDTALQELE